MVVSSYDDNINAVIDMESFEVVERIPVLGPTESYAGKGDDRIHAGACPGT